MSEPDPEYEANWLAFLAEELDEEFIQVVAATTEGPSLEAHIALMGAAVVHGERMLAETQELRERLEAAVAPEDEKEQLRRELEAMDARVHAHLKTSRHALEVWTGRN